MMGTDNSWKIISNLSKEKIPILKGLPSVEIMENLPH